MHLFSTRRARQARWIIVAGVLVAEGLRAETPARTGIAWIDWAADQLAFTLQEAAPADPAPRRPAVTHSIESMEINRLREEIRLLRDLMEMEVIGRVISLEMEVRTLRGALQQQQIAAYGAGPVVPQPGPSAPGPQLAPPPAEIPMPRQGYPADEDWDLPPPKPFAFTVVDEWGRSPETVAELGGGATTLIGVAGAVPPRSARADIVALGRQLRAEYEAYDNINIEVFDTETAARDFAESQTVDPEHHVLSISRHRASGRDLIIYLTKGEAETIPLSAE